MSMSEAKSAKGYLEDSKPDPVVLDLSPNGFDAWNGLQDIRGKGHHLPVLMRVSTLQAVAQIPGANIKEFLVTILSEVKRSQTQCLSPKGEFWVCSETNFRMVNAAKSQPDAQTGREIYLLSLL